MKEKSIIYEFSKPAKTFATNTYLVLGIILTVIGLYYFTTQNNWERPGEFIPLGFCFIIGLCFLAGYQGKWILPNSKPSFSKYEYTINIKTNELECCYIFNQHPPKKHVICSLNGVASFDYKVETKTTTSKVGDFEDSYGTGLGHTMPTGINYRYRTVTSTSTTNYIILLPSNEKKSVTSSISNMSNFALELNELLASKNIT